MTEKLNTVKTVLLNNSRWIILVVAGIVVMWLNSKYVPRSDYEDLKVEVEVLKTNALLHNKDLERLKDRFEKKVAIQNKHTEEIDENENNIIKLITLQK